MGLNERRKMKELQDGVIPERTREIAEICGVAIPYEVDWNSFAEDMQALNFVDNIACHRLNMALRTLCIDAMGKDAVRDGLKLVKIRNVANASEAKVEFSAGVLSMQGAYGQGLSGAIQDSGIYQELVNKL
ncbi:MAG: hypothetical protein HY820_05760 [Acidobacteria bacterium]|nr:hypothetical protein [Acidobacteriota bacterium]